MSPDEVEIERFDEEADCTVETVDKEGDQRKIHEPQTAIPRLPNSAADAARSATH